MQDICLASGKSWIVGEVNLLAPQLHESVHELATPVGLLGVATYMRGRGSWQCRVVEEEAQLLRGGNVVDDGYGAAGEGRADGTWSVGGAHGVLVYWLKTMRKIR